MLCGVVEVQIVNTNCSSSPNWKSTALVVLHQAKALSGFVALRVSCWRGGECWQSRIFHHLEISMRLVAIYAMNSEAVHSIEIEMTRRWWNQPPMRKRRGASVHKMLPNRWGTGAVTGWMTANLRVLSIKDKLEILWLEYRFNLSFEIGWIRYWLRIL